MERMDAKDWRLLYELDLNSRQPMRELARKIGLSKDSTIYRVNKLCESGVIKRFQTLVDAGKLGYTSYRLFLRLQNVTPRKEQEIIGFLRQERKVSWMVSVEDGWSINTWIPCRTVHEMNLLWKKLMERYRNFIEKRWLSIFTKVTYFSKDYLIPDGSAEKRRRSFVFITEPDQVKIDVVSEEILKMLVLNSRTSSVDIASRLSVSSKTVAKKIRDLEKHGIISCYRLMIDLDKIGYRYYKMHLRLHNVTKDRYDSLSEFVASHGNVVYIDEVLGGEDFEIELHVKNIDELRGFISSLKERFASIISKYDIMLYYKEHKYVGLPVG